MTSPRPQESAPEHTSECPNEQLVAWRRTCQLLSAPRVDPRQGHMEGVTEPKQAEPTNGVHTDVSVCCHYAPSAGRLFSPVITSIRDLLCGISVGMKSSSPSSHYALIVLQPLRLRYAPGAGWSLALGEPVVLRSVRVSSVKLPEYLQTSYRKVVVWLLSRVLTGRVVEPLDKVQNAASLLVASKDLVKIVFLALFDVVGLWENL